MNLRNGDSVTLKNGRVLRGIRRVGSRWEGLCGLEFVLFTPRAVAQVSPRRLPGVVSGWLLRRAITLLKTYGHEELAKDLRAWERILKKPDYADALHMVIREGPQ